MKAYSQLQPDFMDERDGIANGGVIALTRKAGSYVEDCPAFEVGGGLKFCRGLLYGCAISVAFWLMVGRVVWLVTR